MSEKEKRYTYSDAEESDASFYYDDDFAEAVDSREENFDQLPENEYDDGYAYDREDLNGETGDPYDDVAQDRRLYDDRYANEGREEGRYENRRDVRRREGGRREKGRKRRIGFSWIIPAVLIGIFLFSSYNFIRQLWIYEQAKNEYKALDSFMEAIPEDTEEETTVEVEASEPTLRYPNLNINYDGLSEVNSQFVGVIYIPVLDLKYPMAQADDNDKYLHTTFEGTYNSSGCIFLDTVASSDFSDSNTFVFGHNMKNETMFGSLKRFLQDEDLCDENPYIYIYQKDQVLIYRIFAYYTIPVQDDVYDDFEGDDGYDAYVADAKNHSVYQISGSAEVSTASDSTASGSTSDTASESVSSAADDETTASTPSSGTGSSVKNANDQFPIDWSERPNLLTLSTCYATGHVNNFVVQGALIGTVSTTTDSTEAE